MHCFTIIFVAFAATMRVWMKWRQAALSDALLLGAHLLYIAYWVVLLLSLISSLGKSEEITSDDQESKAAKLVFASRIVFVVLLAITKLSTLSLIREIFTKNATKWWFRVLVIVSLIQGMAGSLLISVHCSPASALIGKGNHQCPGSESRWIAFTTVEAILEVLLVIPVGIIVMRLQTNLQKKIWAITVFMCRLVVWIPAWLHLSAYIHFLRNGRNNIDIVPTMINEILWVGLALVSASTPVLMRVAKKFTTSGAIFTMSTGYGSKDSRGDPRRPGFRPDNVTNTSQVDTHMMKSMHEGASIGSNADSHVGILRQVDFQVSSENR